MLTVKPSETIGTIGGSAGGIHPYHLGEFFTRRIKILGPVPQHLRSQALGMDDFDFFEDSKKKVKLTYRSIDSEWEPTKKYE